MALCLPFGAVSLVHPEFESVPGELSRPTRTVIADYCGGRLKNRRTLGRRDLGRLTDLPFLAGRDALVVAYDGARTAEGLRALGLPPPTNLLDLHSQFRIATNGVQPSDQATFEHAVRFLRLDSNTWRPPPRLGRYRDPCRAPPRARSPGATPGIEELRDLFEYLCPRSQNTLGRALIRGRSVSELAAIVGRGIPVDNHRLDLLKKNWRRIRREVAGRMPPDLQIFQDGVITPGLFERLLQRLDIEDWPRTPTGAFDLEFETLRDMAKTYSALEPIKDLAATIQQIDPTLLAVGGDGRHRFDFRPFWTVTGRNTPPAKTTVFSNAVWLRWLMKASSGRALIYVDWSAQEPSIAAALSEDPEMLADLATGDIYSAFGKRVGLTDKKKCKAAMTAILYGVGAPKLAIKLGVSQDEARRIIDTHHETYHRFWAWIGAAMDYAYAELHLFTPLGWTLHLSPETKAGTVQNLVLQGTGADLLRVATIYAAEAGIETICLVHDALMVECDIDDVEDIARATQAVMARASADVLGGLEIGTSVEIFKHPDRYRDRRGEALWNLVFGQILGMEP